MDVDGRVVDGARSRVDDTIDDTCVDDARVVGRDGRCLCFDSILVRGDWATSLTVINTWFNLYSKEPY